MRCQMKCFYYIYCFLLQVAITTKQFFFNYSLFNSSTCCPGTGYGQQGNVAKYAVLFLRIKMKWKKMIIDFGTPLYLLLIPINKFTEK